MSIRRSIVIHSGGLASSTAGLMAAAVTDLAGVVYFDYGQPRVEFECFEYWAKRLDARAVVLPVPSMSAIGDPLLAIAGDDNRRHRPTVAPSGVPGRNLVFMTLAAGVAARLGASEIWTGINATTTADEKPDTLDALQLAIKRGIDSAAIQLIAPFKGERKAAVWRGAEQTGHLSDLVEHTWACYRGEKTRRMPWGYGCGRCMACDTRRTGFNQYFGDRR